MFQSGEGTPFKQSQMFKLRKESFRPLTTSQNSVKERFGEVLQIKINQAMEDLQDRYEELEGI